MTEQFPAQQSERELYTPDVIERIMRANNLNVLRSDKSVEGGWSYLRTEMNGDGVVIWVTRYDKTEGQLDKPVRLTGLLALNPDLSQPDTLDVEHDEETAPRLGSMTLRAVEPSSARDDGGSAEIVDPNEAVDRVGPSSESLHRSDELFSVNEQELQYPIRPKDKEAAQQRLNAMPVVQYILKKVYSTEDLPVEAMVDALRSNEVARKAVGSMLFIRMGQVADALPDDNRVHKNGIKRSNLARYARFGDTTSQEYATLLALSMLSGEFDESMATSSPIVYDASGNALVGQHRDAAQRVLATFEEKMPEDAAGEPPKAERMVATKIQRIFDEQLDPLQRSLYTGLLENLENQQRLLYSGTSVDQIKPILSAELMQGPISQARLRAVSESLQRMSSDIVAVEWSHSSAQAAQVVSETLRVIMKMVDDLTYAVSSALAHEIESSNADAYSLARRLQIIADAAHGLSAQLKILLTNIAELQTLIGAQTVGE